MEITKRQLTRIIKTAMLEEGSKRDAQGLGVLINEITRAVIDKIKKIESMNKDVTTKKLEEDTTFALHKKIEKDIEHCFLELEAEGQKILEKALRRTLNKNSVIYKIPEIGISISFKEAKKPFQEGIKIFLPSASFSPGTNGIYFYFVVVKSYSSEKNNNYKYINGLISRLHEVVFHETHHFKQANEFHTIDMRGAAPSPVKLSKAKKDWDELKGIEKYAKGIKALYAILKRSSFSLKSDGSEDAYNNYLEKTNNYIKSLKRISSIKDQLLYFAEDFIRYIPGVPSSYRKYSLDAEKAPVFLIYYYFSKIEVEAYVVGMMRKARIKVSKVDHNTKYIKRRYKNMSKDEISYENKHLVVFEFYQICLEASNRLYETGSSQITSMYEDAIGLQKIGIDLEKLLNKHKKLCDDLIGLWFIYAIERYGIFKEFFDLEKEDIKKWRFSGRGSGKGTNPQYALKPKFDRYIRRI